jgi:hypothetical protein
MSRFSFTARPDHDGRQAPSAADYLKKKSETRYSEIIKG